MKNFLKSFFSGEKSPEEQAILAAQNLQRQRDVMVLSAENYEGSADQEDEQEGCAPQTSCCGGGCSR